MTSGNIADSVAGHAGPWRTHPTAGRAPPVVFDGGDSMRASVFVAASLDGFIAREDGGLDWLTEYEQPGGEDYGFTAFMDTVDAIVMGRHTYEKVLTLGEWPYGRKPLLVLSNGVFFIPKHLAATIERGSGAPVNIIERLQARGAQHVYIDGGKTIQGFLRDGLINRLTITRIPVLLGKGIPLFADVARNVRARHVATRSFPNGLVQSEYEIVA